MFARTRIWLALAALAALSLAAAGCATTPRSKPSPTPSPTPGPTTSTNSKNPGDDISRIVKDRTKDARKVETIIMGNVALVGIDKGSTARPTAPQAPTTGAGTPPPGAPGVTAPTTPTPSGARPGTPVPPTTVAPAANRINVIPSSVQGEIMRRFPGIVRVHSTDDSNVVSRLTSIARDIRNRRSVADRANEIAYLMSITSPDRATAPARTATDRTPSTTLPPGTTAPAPTR